MLKKILAILAFLMSAAVAMAAVDVNKASEAELDSVKGIGPGTSKLIVTERKKGEFKNWDDFITRVKGVGEKRATHLSEAGLTVGGTSYKGATPKAETKADAKTDKKDVKAETKARDAKAEAKAEKKEAKAEAKEAKAEAKADAKEAKAEAKADKAKLAASAAKK
ncbi:MAG: ComEA family DNA-binding protein [Ramlibacter sp.]